MTLQANRAVKKVTLTSRSQSPTDQPFCLEFDLYAFSNRADAEVSLYELQQGTSWTRAWSHRRYNRDHWTKVRLHLSSNVTTLRLTTNLYSFSVGRMAATAGSCPQRHGHLNTFEPADPILLQPERMGSFRVLQAGLAPAELPLVDTTLGGAEGHYLTTIGREFTRERLFTPELQPGATYCFRMQLFKPDEQRDLVELAHMYGDYPLWTSQSLSTLEQTSLEDQQRELFERAQQRQASLDRNGDKDEDSSSDSDDEPNRKNVGQPPIGPAEPYPMDELPTLVETMVHSGGWHQMQVTLDARIAVGLQLTVSRTEQSLPIAIDDVAIQLGACQEDPNCDFDQNDCQLQFSSTSGVLFLLGTGRLQRPQKVYTYRRLESLDAGKDYAYLDLTDRSVFDRQSSLPSTMQVETRWLQPTGSQGACFSVRYLLTTERAGEVQLTFSVHDRTGIRPLQTVSQPSFKWTELQVDVVSMERFRLSLQLTHAGQTAFVPFFAVDAMRLDREGLCDPPEGSDDRDEVAELEELSCTFDEDLCGWNGTGWRVSGSLEKASVSLLPVDEYGGGPADDSYLRHRLGH